MISNAVQSRASTFSIGRGLHLLRYTRSDDSIAPVATIRVLSGNVEVIASPGRPKAELNEVGACLALLSEGDSTLEIVLSASAPNSSLDATFSLDVADRGAAPAPERRGWDDARQNPAPAQARTADRVQLRVDAHVSRIGDVAVAAGEWVAGPNRPLPIEGLSVLTDSRAIGVEIRALPLHSRGQWSGWCRPGEFAGSRQRAEPLAGIRLRLVGPGCEGYRLRAEALFLGSPVVKKAGDDIELAGFDPLVGLNLAIESVVDRPQQALDLDETRRVRVFRAQQR